MSAPDTQAKDVEVTGLLTNPRTLDVSAVIIQAPIPQTLDVSEAQVHL